MKNSLRHTRKMPSHGSFLRLFMKLINHSSAMLYPSQHGFVNGQVKFCPGKYIMWHTCTCPADDLEEKMTWIPVVQSEVLL